MANVCRKVELGRHGSIPELKIKWEGSPIPTPKAFCRTSSLVVYAEFCAPDDLLDNAWNDIVNCAILAGVVAGIATIAASPAVALAAFEASFNPCIAGKLAGRANELHVALSSKQEPNEDWHRC